MITSQIAAKLAAFWKLSIRLLRKRPFITITVAVPAVSLILLFSISRHVSSTGQSYEVSMTETPTVEVAIVPGAAVHPNGTMSGVLQDRVDRVIQLYRQKKVKKLLMSGDHGTTSYNEVDTMGRYAVSRGIPSEDIFLDHAGFTTYESMYRARYVFQVKQAIIVTQQFHLDRAVYIARSLGIEAWGVQSDLHSYGNEGYFETRELPARVKAFVQVNIHSQPTYLGPAIPISGDGRRTHDRTL